MRKIYILIILCFCITKVNSQIVGTDCFMQGNYIEIGINGCGAFGSAALPPASGPLGPYHCNTGPAAASPLSGLGFIADSGGDGWADFCGDYFVPGSPVEGWSLCFDGACYINTDQWCTVGAVPGGTTSIESSCGINLTEWAGAVGGLQVKQYVNFGVNDLYFTISVELCNISSSVINNVYYGRNVDPDNDAQQLGDYTTTQTIVSQAYLGDPVSQVNAISASGCVLSMISSMPNSCVCFGGFSTENADQYWYATTGSIHTFTVGATNTADEAVSLGMFWPSLNPGECVLGEMQYYLTGIPPTPLFDIPNFCAPGPSMPPVLGPDIIPGGTFSFTVPPADAATIDPITGIINNGTAGVDYAVTYFPPPPCPSVPAVSSVHVNSCCGNEAGTINTPVIPTEYCINAPATASVPGMSVTGSNTTPPFLNTFCISDAAGNILSFNATGNFAGLDSGSYCIHALNYDSSDPDIPLGGFTLANYPTITLLYNAVNMADDLDKPGPICAELTYVNCHEVLVSEEMSAGTPSSQNYCNNNNVIVNLLDLLTGEDAGGVWTETSATTSIPGGFNAALGTFNPFGQPNGTYTFQYWIAANYPCSNDSSVVSIVVSQAPSAAFAGLDQNLCSATSFQLAATTPSFGLGTWSVVSGPPGLTIVDVNDPVSNFTVASPGNYILQWAVSNGPLCPTVTDDVELIIANIPSVTSTIDTLFCLGDTVQLNYIGNGEVVDNFVWDFDGAYYEAGYGDGPFDLAWDNQGYKDIVLTVSTGDGCTNDTVIRVHVLGTEINVLEDATITYGENIDLINAIAPSSMPVSYVWTPDTWLDCATCPVPNAAPLDPIKYYVTITDTNGCQFTDSIFINIILERTIFIPSAFSPNGDGLNDIWTIYNRTLKNVTAAVYNRWGEKVFAGNGSNIAWDGKYNDKKLDPGVYVYVVEIEYVDGKKTTLKGNVSIIL